MVRPASTNPTPSLTMGDIVLAAGPTFLYQSGLPFHKQRAFHRMAACGTGLLGWYLRQCDDCGTRRASGRKCHDRNCPSCGGKRARDWVEARESEIFPCPYFHYVFTLPDELRTLCMENEAILFDLLFTASRETLMKFAQNPKHLGATPSMFQVLHTTTRSLDYHPHCHIPISAGGYDEKNKRWVDSRSEHYLFPVRAVSRVFRGIFLEALKDLYAQGKLGLIFTQNAHLQDPRVFQALLDQLYAEKWHVYTKEAFGGPRSVVRYLGRYTHKTAIHNRQLKSLIDGQVTYGWTDRKTGQERTRTQPVDLFLKTFARHILPKGFHRIRYAGLLARNKKHLLLEAQIAAHRHKELPPHQDPTDALKPKQPSPCPCCPGTLRLVRTVIRKVDYLAFPNPNGLSPPWGWALEEAA